MQELHDQLMQSCGNAQAELNKQAKSIGEAQLQLFVYFGGVIKYQQYWEYQQLGRYIFAVVILHGDLHVLFDWGGGGLDGNF